MSTRPEPRTYSQSRTLYLGTLSSQLFDPSFGTYNLCGTWTTSPGEAITRSYLLTLDALTARDWRGRTPERDVSMAVLRLPSYRRSLFQEPSIFSPIDRVGFFANGDEERFVLKRSMRSEAHIPHAPEQLAVRHVAEPDFAAFLDVALLQQHFSLDHLGIKSAFPLKDDLKVNLSCLQNYTAALTAARARLRGAPSSPASSGVYH